MINFLKKLLSKTINYTYNLRLRKCTVHYVQYSCLQLNSHKLLPACRLGSYPVQINIVLHLGAFKLYYNMHLEILKNFHLENRFFVSCISVNSRTRHVPLESKHLQWHCNQGNDLALKL